LNLKQRFAACGVLRWEVRVAASRHEDPFEISQPIVDVATYARKSAQLVPTWLVRRKVEHPCPQNDRSCRVWDYKSGDTFRQCVQLLRDRVQERLEVHWLPWPRSYKEQELVLVPRPFFWAHTKWGDGNWPALKPVLPEELEAVCSPVQRHERTLIEQPFVAVMTKVRSMGVVMDAVCPFVCGLAGGRHVL